MEGSSFNKNYNFSTSLLVWCLGLQASTAGGMGLIAGGGTRIPQGIERQKKNQQQLYSGQSLYSFTSKSAILHSHWKPEGIQPDQTIHVLFQACLRYVPAFTNVTVTDGMLSLSVILHPAFQIHFKIHFPETTQTKESLPFSKITGLINSITVLNLIICKCVFL